MKKISDLAAHGARGVAATQQVLLSEPHTQGSKQINSTMIFIYFQKLQMFKFFFDFFLKINKIYIYKRLNNKKETAR